MLVKVMQKGTESDILKISKTEAELIPYVNKVTGESDPILSYTKGHFVHVSTVHRLGGVVISAETLEPVEDLV